jgi:hypothetical protein
MTTGQPRVRRDRCRRSVTTTSNARCVHLGTQVWKATSNSTITMSNNGKLGTSYGLYTRSQVKAQTSSKSKWILALAVDQVSRQESI